MTVNVLTRLLSSGEGTPWYVVLGGVVAVVIGAMPLVLALWKGFHKNNDGEVAVKYRSGRPVVTRFGPDRGSTLLRGAGIRFAMYGFGEWRRMTVSDQTTDTETRPLDLADGTQVELTISFVYGLRRQPVDRHYLPEDVALVRYLRAAQGELETIVLKTFLTRAVEAIKASRLRLEEITSQRVYQLLAPGAEPWFAERGAELRVVNVTATKTLAQKLGEGPAPRAATAAALTCG